MIETWLYALAVGVLLGVFFFGGLWFTVRKAVGANTPELWFLLSFIVRMSAVLASFYAISSSGTWQHLSIALLGFVLARMALICFTSSPTVNSAKAHTHAS